MTSMCAPRPLLCSQPRPAHLLPAPSCLADASAPRSKCPRCSYYRAPPAPVPPWAQIFDIRNHKCVQSLYDRELINMPAISEDAVIPIHYDSTRRQLVTGYSKPKARGAEGAGQSWACRGLRCTAGRMGGRRLVTPP